MAYLQKAGVWQICRMLDNGRPEESLILADAQKVDDGKICKKAPDRRAADRRWVMAMYLISGTKYIYIFSLGRKSSFLLNNKSMLITIPDCTLSVLCIYNLSKFN